MSGAGPNFAVFRDGLGGTICRSLGVNVMRCGSWDDYALEMLRFAQDGSLTKAARALDVKASSGECDVLRAVLAAADFGWLADELGSEGLWNRISGLDKSVREAIAAVILRRD